MPKEIENMFWMESCITSGSGASTFPEHLRSPPNFSEVCVARSLFFCVAFVDHCLSFVFWPIVCPSSSYGFWLLLWYLLAIILSVLHRVTASDYFFGISWPLYCLSFIELRFWLLLWYLLAIILSVLLWSKASDYPFGIFWPLYCLSFFDLQLLITPLVFFGHCIVCPSSSYGFWLSLWYLLAIVLFVLLRVTASDYLLVSFGRCIVRPSLSYASD